MTPQQTFTIYEASKAAITGEMTFPQIVAKLAQIGVERYHADYTRQEKTYYFANGESLAVTCPWGDHPTAEKFAQHEVEAAVRQSQRNEHTYTDFVRKTMAAGCVGYFVQIAGKRALYFGRNGEIHTEWFPGAQQNSAAAPNPPTLHHQTTPRQGPQNPAPTLTSS